MRTRWTLWLGAVIGTAGLAVVAAFILDHGDRGVRQPSAEPATGVNTTAVKEEEKSPPTLAAPLPIPVRPGMVRIQAQTCRIGIGLTELKAFAQLVKKALEELHLYFRSTPEHTVSIGTFDIGLTEVTCEEYNRFVKDTGYKPPKHWTGAGLGQATCDLCKLCGRLRVL